MMNNETKEILNRRARMLANRKSGFTTQLDFPKLIRFNIAKEQFAISLSHVSEVLTLKDITPITNAPAFVAGIINYRGDVISVINLKVLLNLTEIGLTEMNKILVLKDDTMIFGILADGVSEVFLFDVHQKHSKPINISGFASEVTTGITTDGVILLDAERLIQHPSLKVS